MRIPTITTSRLLLRAFAEDDAEPLHDILNDGDTLRSFPSPNPPSRDQVRKLIARQLTHREERRFGWWAVELHNGNRLIGWSGLQFLPETGEVEVAYLLSRAFWQQGLSTEAAGASLQYGFEKAGLKSTSRSSIRKTLLPNKQSRSWECHWSISLATSEWASVLTHQNFTPMSDRPRRIHRAHGLSTPPRRR